MTHICISDLTSIGSDNGLSPGRRQAINRTNAGILLIEPLGTNFNEILIKIHTFSFKKMPLKTSSAKRRPFCLGLNVLNKWKAVAILDKPSDIWFKAWFLFYMIHCMAVSFYVELCYNGTHGGFNLKMSSNQYKVPIRSPGSWFNITMASYHYMKSHCGDNTAIRLSYLQTGISYTGKTTSLHWIPHTIVLNILHPAVDVRIKYSSENIWITTQLASTATITSYWF